MFNLACGETAPTPVPPTLAPVGPAAPKGERILSIDITEAQGEAYETAFTLAQSLGMEDASLTVFWDEMETAPGVFNPDPNWLAIANLFYGAQGTAAPPQVAGLFDGYPRHSAANLGAYAQLFGLTVPN